MNIDQAAMFLACSILVGFGVIVIVATAVIINNLLSNYWKPVAFSRYIFPQASGILNGESPRFVDTTEPTMNKAAK